MTTAKELISGNGLLRVSYSQNVSINDPSNLHLLSLIHRVSDTT